MKYQQPKTEYKRACLDIFTTFSTIRVDIEFMKAIASRFQPGSLENVKEDLISIIKAAKDLEEIKTQLNSTFIIHSTISKFLNYESKTEG